jgi:chitinase
MVCSTFKTSRQTICQTELSGAVVRRFNQAARVPFLFDARSGQFISYDDAESFRYKLGFLKEGRLGGAMYWEITADRKGSLLDLVARELLPAER